MDNKVQSASQETVKVTIHSFVYTDKMMITSPAGTITTGDQSLHSGLQARASVG